MGLINADDMIKSLMDMTFYDEEGHIIDDYEDRLAIVKSFVDPVPTVEAIPIAWIEKYAELLSTIDRTFCKLQAIQIRVMLNDWYVEQANQKNEQENEQSEDGSEVQ